MGRVDLAALGKCGSRIGLVSARASSACEVPVELAGGPSFKLVAILVTAVRVCPGQAGGVEQKRKAGQAGDVEQKRKAGQSGGVEHKRKAGQVTVLSKQIFYEATHLNYLP